MARLALSPDLNRPLTNVPLRLYVQDSAHGQIALEGEATRRTTAGGIVRWTLRYRNLTWANMAEARFRIACGIPDASGFAFEQTYVDLDIGQNVLTMLREFKDAQGRLRLTNPMFNTAQSAWWRVAQNLKFPFVLRGPVYNAAVLSACLETGDDYSQYPYVCMQLRDRIADWLASRRNGSDQQSVEASTPMNGIEFNTYQFWPIHVWTGIHLSGSGPSDDPRFLDPWWTQEWLMDKYASPNGLLNWKWEFTYLTGLATYSALLVVAVAYAIGVIAEGVAATSAWAAAKSAAAQAKGGLVWAYRGLKAYLTGNWPRATTWATKLSSLAARLTSGGSGILQKTWLKLSGAVSGVTGIYYMSGVDNERLSDTRNYVEYPRIELRVLNWREAQATCPFVYPFKAQQREETS